MDETAYLTKVRAVLDELGSADSSADITGSGDYWKHCRHAGIDPKVCAATIYSGVRHRHEVARTVIKEAATGASEAPVREEWEVVVKRAGASADSLTSIAGRRPDEVTTSNAIFAGFRDDEKAADFSKKMTKAGYIAHYGPRRDYTLHEEARAPRDIDEHALEELDLYIENDARLYPQKKAILANIERKVRAGSYDAELAPKLWIYWVDAGAKAYAKEFADPEMWKVIYPKSLRVELARRIARREYEELLIQMGRGGAAEGVQSQITAKRKEWIKVIFDSEAAAIVFREELERSPYTASVMGRNVWTDAPYSVVQKAMHHVNARGQVHREAEEPPSASAEEKPATECATCIPWQKVSRDGDAATANVELAKKYGAIKNAKDVYRVVGDALNKEDSEVFLVIPLDLRGELKGAPYEVARGQYSRVAVGVENVMAAVYAAHCEAFVCVHNHPTGKVTPSVADKHLTDSIRDAVRPLGKGVTFVDHVVIGSKCAYSITEKKKYIIKP